MRTWIDLPSAARPTYPGDLPARGWLKRVGATVAIWFLFTVSVISGPAVLNPTLLRECPLLEASSCFTNPAIDLAVVLDRSGSLGGEAYNIQIEGLASALRDPAVIPRDGSVGISVITFADQPAIVRPLETVNSAADAERLAKEVEGLKCPAGVACPVRGDQPASNFGAAITGASFQLRRTQGQDGKPISRRVLLISTDGECTDPDCGQNAASIFKRCDGAPSQLEVVLIGSGQSGHKAKAARPVSLNLCNHPDDNKAKAECLVSLGSCPDQPGTVRVINPNGCADGQSRYDAPACFVANLRRVLRSHVQPLALTVTRMSDSVADATADAGGLTLRRALEMANARGGETTITFDLNGGQKRGVITLNAPLPPICAPGITIDGGATSGDLTETPGQPLAPAITIDGGARFCDGLFIRSNRARIQRLKLVNFSRAAITIASLSPGDHVGSNRIEGNVLENNSQAGVLVLDPSPNPANAVVRNERNTIVGNSITGSATPIDLAGDGASGNDDGDADQGPNTLLNFPRIDSVEGPPARAIIKGTFCGADADGPSGNCRGKLPARIDVFEVAELGATASADTAGSAKAGDSERWPPDLRPIVSIKFLKFTDVRPDGTFAVEVGESLTGGYAMTATDSDGNTSEVSFPCRGFAKILLGSGSLSFPKANAGSVVGTATLTVQNIGCDCLRLRSALVTRTDSPDQRITLLGDSAHFPLTGLEMDMNDSPVVVFPGQQHNSKIEFKPDIPRVVSGAEEKAQGLSAAQLLPRKVIDRLTLKYDGGENQIQLTGRVKPRIKLIHPDQPQQPPLVVLHRSGDSFFVEFSIYDSDLNDVDHAIVEFFDADQRQVPVDNKTIDLRGAISARGLMPGQSFNVMQRYDNAGQHDKVKSVKVQVFGHKTNTSDSAMGELSSIAPATVSSRKRPGRLTGLPSGPLKQGMTRLKTDD